jgi:NAD-dependent deacetylase
MSAESGINTFRDSNGLWEKHDIKEVATPDAWQADPDLVTEFYNQRRKQIINAKPNQAHLEIARLQDTHDVSVITQNIDDLHERAGSIDVLHLHGNIRYSKSSGPNPEKAYYRIEGSDLTENDLCPEGFRLRPHVVWFGESVPMLEKAIEITNSATHFVVIGSSLEVYPAASLIQYCSIQCKKWIIDPNAEKMNIQNGFQSINLPAGEGIKVLLKELSF